MACKYKYKGQIYSYEELKALLSPKTRRILEVQSDLFQKGRGKENLINKREEYSSSEAFKNDETGRKRINRAEFDAINGIIVVDSTKQEFYKSEEVDKADLYKPENRKDSITAVYKYDNGKRVAMYNLSSNSFVKIEYGKRDSTENQFLQLLNKDNNWATFFVKSIIQDSAKKGYEKVLFPAGNTASKVEGQTTLEEFKKQKYRRISELESQKPLYTNPEERAAIKPRTFNLEDLKGDYLQIDNEWVVKIGVPFSDSTLEARGFHKDLDGAKKEAVRIYNNLFKEWVKGGTKADIVNREKIEREIDQLKAELKQVEGPGGLAAFKPIYNFYENTVGNILKKQGFNPEKITDEYGNTWNEIEIQDSASEPILFGLNTQNQEQLEFHVNTLNVVSQFLENIGVEQRLVTDFLSQDGNVVEGAIAAANFIEGTVDIIGDLEKGRAEAWNKLPEEAAHWWYRLLDKNSELKDALLTSALTDRKEEELRNSLYGETYKDGPKVIGKLALDSNGNVTSKPALSAIREESIGQLIAEAIKRIETKNANAADYSFFKKFLEWINSIIDVFKNTTQDPFEVAAMKILSSDMSDLMTWEDYRKLNNIVNFADVLTEQSVAPIDYTLINDIGFIGSTFMEDAEGNATSGYRFHFRDSDWIKKYGDNSPSFYTQEELDNWVSSNIKEHDIRQKQQIQEVRDNQIFFDRLLNKTFRKKSKFLPKTLRKYFDIIDAQNLNPLREWNISQELQQITKKLSEQEKKQIVETNGYTNIAPTLKILPNLLQKYGRRTTPEIIKQEIEITNKLVKKEITKEQAIELRQKLENKKKGNPIVLSETIKIDGAKKQELSILNGIREMIKLENPNLKSITAEEFVNEAHNWLETNYLLGFANENSYLSYRTDQTFSYLSDRQSNEYVDITNMTEEELQRLPFEERQRIANIVGLTKQNPDVYHNKVSLRFNDMYHLKSGHFDKSPSAWGNLTYFYTGKNKWKDAVLLHEIQNDNIEFLREFKAEKVDLETSLGRYLQQLNIDLLDNITQIESGGKRIQKKIDIDSKQTHIHLNYQLQQIKDLPLEQGLQQLKQNLNEVIELYKSDSSKDINKAQEVVDRAYSLRRKFQDFQKRGGIKSLLSQQELNDLKELLNSLNTEEVMGQAVYMPEENQYEPGYPTIRNLKQKKQAFETQTQELQVKINSKLKELYGDNAPRITLQAPAKPLPKSQRNMRTIGYGQNQRRTGGASQELNENVNFLIAFSEKQVSTQLSKNIEESKKNYIFARNATVGNNFNVALSKITHEQYAILIENYKYNEDLLNRLIDEQAQKDVKSPELEKVAKAKSIIEYLGDDPSVKLGKGKYGFVWDTADTDKAIVSVWDAYKAANTNEDSYVDNWTVDEFLDYVKKIAPEYLTLDTKNIAKENQQSKFETLKQKALDKKAELEKNYGKIEEEVKQTLEIEMNYFTPLVHHLIQKHINQYGKDFPMYFSGYHITKLTQGNDRTAMIYAGKDEINIVDKSDFFINGKGYKKFNDGSIIKTDVIVDAKGKILGRQNQEKATQQEYEKAYQQATERKAKEIKFEAAQQIGFLSNEYNGTNLSDLTDKQLEEGIKELNQYKRQSRQNMDRVINSIMNISNSKPIETGAIYNAMSQISGIKLIWQDSIPGLKGKPVNKVNRTITSNSGNFLVKRGGFEQSGTYNTMEEAEQFIAKHSANFGYSRDEYEIIDVKKEISGGTGGYLVDLTNYNYNVPVLYGLQNNKTQENSKPKAIEELFESNPELANQVYEALGFNKSVVPNKIISINNTNFGDETPNSENELSFNLKDIQVEEFNDIVRGNKATVYFSVPTDKTISFGERANNIIAQMMLHKDGNIVTISSVAIYSPNFRVGEKQLKVNEGKGIGKYIYELLGDKLLNEQSLILNSDASMSIGAQKVWEYLVKNNKAEKAQDGRYYYKNNQITTQQKQQAQQLYSQYLDTIFPDSKVKDIVYHDGGHGKIKEEGFRKDLIGISDGGVLGNGFYFYFDRTKRYAEQRSHTESVLLNVKNVSTKTEILKLANLENGLGQYEKALSKLSGITVDTKIKGIHGKYIGNYAEALTKIGVDGVKGKYGTGEEIVVFEPEQIHILGGKQDIEGFKNFVGEQSSEPIINPSDALINKYLQAKEGTPLASNGKPSILYKSILDLPEVNGNKEMAYKMYLKTQSPAFKQWFGESKVVDENGEPLLVYHGTNTKFDIFNTTQRRSFRDTGAVDGYFFTTQSQNAQEFGDIIVPVYLNASNPEYQMSFDKGDKLEKEEFDSLKSSGKINDKLSYEDYLAIPTIREGLRVNDSDSIFESKEGDRKTKVAEPEQIINPEYPDEVKFIVVFEPDQIKSVFNRGSFITADNNVILEVKRDDYNPDEEGGEIWKIEVIESEAKVGEVMLENDGTNLTIFDTEIKGGDEVNTGTNAYMKIAEKAQEAGLTFRSDVIESKLRPMSDAAKNLWNRFVEAGQAIIQAGRYVFTGTPKKVSDNIYMSAESESESSKAGEITKAKVLRFLKQIGFTNIQSVSVLKHNGNQIDGNAYVDLMAGVMQIVNGKEDIALPEEAMHILVELIQQSSPELFRSLEKEIVNYQLYRTVINDKKYRNDKNYQNPDGSPNYPKLKKEAIAKLLAEYLINNGENTVESAEKMRKIYSLWRTILDWIRNTFTKYKNPFQKIVDDIEVEDIGELYGTFQQLSPMDELFMSATKKTVDERDKEYEQSKALYETLLNSARDHNISKVDEQYYQNHIEWTGTRVSDLTKKFYLQLFRNRPLDPSLQAYYDQMSEDGTFLHSLFESAIKNHIDPVTGLLKNTPDPINNNLTDNPIDEVMNKKIYDWVKVFLSQYEEGTRFLSETIILDNEKKVLGTVDFMALVPVKDTTGKIVGTKTDIFDWKTVLTKPEALADYKREAINIQLSEYKRILTKDYGIKDFGKIRAIRIDRSYKKQPGDTELSLFKIDIGDPDASKIIDDTLRPIISNEESTGDPIKDKIIKGLSAIYQKFVNQMKEKKKDNDNRLILKDIGDAIYDIRIQNSIAHLNKYLVDLGVKIKVLVDGINSKPDPTAEELDNFLMEISMYQDIYESLVDSDKSIIPLVVDATIDKEERSNLSQYTTLLGQRVHELKEFRKTLVAKQAEKVGIFNLIKPEEVVKVVAATFRAMGNHPVGTLRYFYELTKKAFNKASLETSQELDTLKELKGKFNALVKKKGWSLKEAESKIINFTKGTLHSKISKDFFDQRKEVLAERNPEKIKNFVRANYNFSEYIAWYNQELKTQEDLWKVSRYHADPVENNKIIERNRVQFKKNFDINKYPTTAFNSLNTRLWNKNIKEELWISKEYQELESYKEADGSNPLLEIYDFFVKKNRELFDVGAIDEWKVYTFFPNVKKTMADIMSFEDKNWAAKIKDSTFNHLKNLKNSLTIDDYELNSQPKRDPTTGVLLEQRFIPYISELGSKSNLQLATELGFFSNEILSNEARLSYNLLKPKLTFEKYLDLYKKEQENPKLLNKRIEDWKSKSSANVEKFDKIAQESHNKSFDMFTVYGLMSKEIAKEKYLQKNDETSRALLHIEKAQQNYETAKGGKLARDTSGNLIVSAKVGQNAPLFETFFRGITLGQSIQTGTDAQIIFKARKIWNKTPLGKLHKFDTNPDTYKPSAFSLTKALMFLNNIHQKRILGLNAASAASNLFGGTFSVDKLNKKYLTNKDLKLAWSQLTSCAFYQSEDMKKRAALVDYFLPHLNNRENWKAEQLSVNQASTILSGEWLMSLQRKTDELVSTNIFLALIENTGLINGELVNLRELAMQELKYYDRYKLGITEREAVEKRLEERVAELKKSDGLIGKATFKKVGKETIIEIPGVDRFSDTVEKLREISQTMSKDAMGGMDEYDISGYRYNMYWRLFMTFKNWIPRSGDVRFAEFHYSQSHHAWDYGRFRMFARAVGNNYMLSVAKLIPIVGNVLNRTNIGKEDLIKKAMSTYEEKKALAIELGQYDDTFISEGEFVDMFIQGVEHSFAEFRTALILMTILIAGMAAPDDDDDGETKAWKKLVRRQVDKMQDEVSFFYSPKSAIDIVNQSAPIIGLVNDSYNLFGNVFRETVGLTLETMGKDETGGEMREKAKPLKYTFKILPVFKEILNYIPIADSEMGREWGISLTDKRGF